MPLGRAGAIITLVATLSVATPPAAASEGGAEDSDLRAPAVVTGVASIAGWNQRPETATGEGPVAVAATNVGVTLDMELNDPRISGTYETNENVDQYHANLATRTGVGRLTNDGGSWTADYRGFSPFRGNRYVAFLTGEDGYEGLSAMLWMQPDGQSWEVEGVVVPGSWPEPPRWVLPPPE